MKLKQKLQLLLLVLLMANNSYAQESGQRWSTQKVNKWYAQFDWIAGTNFGPSTAINQLEMWQAETFDIETIDRELKWSAELGFNMHRVFLHNLVWEQNSEEFLDRIDQFLEVADKHGIKTMLVLLDDVWDPLPVLGKQKDPIPHLHNSGWVQSPGREYLEDETKHPLIKAYIKGVIKRFKNDNRVAIWDLYNEPANPNVHSYGATSKNKTELSKTNKTKHSLRLMTKVFKWAREVNPSQPLTMGVWTGNYRKWGNSNDVPAVDKVMLEQSDIITFHTYDNNLRDVKIKIEQLKKHGRPILCTEYMARTNNNLFKDVMPLFKQENVGAFNWGFVSGKTNTIYPWQSWDRQFTKEPKVWFHDILRPDGTPFSEEEVKFIKSMTGAEN